MKLSEKIAELRKQKGWSQEQLATKLEVSRQAVYKWEADVNQPDLDKLKRIAHLFNVSYDILMDDNIELPITSNIIEVENEEIPEVEVLENGPVINPETKALHNEVAVQINYNKPQKASASKKPIIILSVIASVVVIAFCSILFGVILQRESYLIKFDSIGGQAVQDQIIKDGKKVNAVSSPTRDGYTFDGWYIGDRKWDFDKDKISGNTTLTAKWIANKNTITYVNDKAAEKKEQSAHTDEILSLAKNEFTKAGYTFLGWATELGGEVKYRDCASFKMGAHSVTLYAVWSADAYNLVLNLNGSTLQDEVTNVFTVNDTVILPTPVLEFYSFDGWFAQDGTKVEIISKGTTSDVVLTAKFSPVNYNIHYELDSGINNEANPDTYTAITALTLLDPTKAGHVFDGWYSDKELTQKITGTQVSQSGSITVYAKWLKIVNITYELDNGINNSLNPSSILENEKISLKAPTKDGYYFAGWFIDNAFTESIENIDGSIKKDMTVYAKYLKIINIKYELDSGINNEENPASILENQTHTLLNPTKEGYVFDGWYKDSAFTSKITVINGSDKTDVTAYAKWLKVINIKYELDGGINNGENPASILENQTHTLLNPSKEGYIFEGWYKDSAFTNKITVVDGSLKSDVTVYAKFTPKVSFIFANNSSGGCTLTACEGVGAIEIPATHNGKSVTEIAPGAFTGQSLITEITIPATVTKIDVTAFNECTSLEKFTVADGNINYASSEGILYNPIMTVIFKYPMGKTDKVYSAPNTLDVVQTNAFYGCIYLEEVNLPNDSTRIDGVGKIGVSAFENCTSLEKIELGYLANYFEDKCFMGCTALQSVEFKHSNIALRNSSFENCTSLTSVVFHGGSYAINDKAFFGCTSLSNVQLGRATSFGSMVFGNTGLKAITIPITVISTGSALFYGCNNLTVTCEASSKPSDWASDWSFGASKVVWNEDYDATITDFMYDEYQDSVTLTGYNGPAGAVFVPDYINGKPVTAIMQGVFSYREDISSVNIPDTIMEIDMSTFDNCTHLAEINVDSFNQYYASKDGVLYNKNYTCLFKYPMNKQNISFVADKELDVIGKNAFKDNTHLQKLSLYEDMTGVYGVGKIYESAFENCTSLRIVQLGYLANYFEQACFKNCQSITQLEFKCASITGIEMSAFECCTALESVAFAGTVGYINSDAFNGCTKLSSVDLGNAKRILSYAFANTALKQIFIPSTVNEISGYAFSGNTDLAAYCEASSKPDGWDDMWNEGVSVVYWGKVGLPGVSRFTYGENGTELSIKRVEGSGTVLIPSYDDNGNKITKIEAGAFSGQTEITEIYIPVSITSIEYGAFDNCPGLEKFTCQNAYGFYRSIDGVLYEDYGQGLLRYPEGKKSESFTIPYHVDNVRNYAFKNNTHLKKVIFSTDVDGDNYVSTLGLEAFSGCTALESVDGCHVTYFNKEVFKNCTSLKELTFYAKNISHLSNQVFLGCSSLEKITFKGNVGATGWQVFGNCTKLKEIIFEGTLNVIGWGCFENCVALESFTVPNGVTAISGEAFKNCQSLRNIEISSSVTTISKNAFLYAPLMYVNIPSTVTTIEDYAFSGIYDLFIFCEATEKPEGWGEKWNYNGEGEGAVPYRTYWDEQYKEPTFEAKVVNESGTFAVITSITNIQNSIVILPSTYDNLLVVAFTSDVDLTGVKEIFLPYYFGYADYETDLSIYPELETVIISVLNTYMKTDA